MADITYIPTWSGFLYLSMVLDVWSRRIVGWAMESHLRTELVLAATNMALAQCRPKNVIHHSDCGCQCTSYSFGKSCQEMGVLPSMDTVGVAYDNAMAESFLATLEREVLQRRYDDPSRPRQKHAWRCSHGSKARYNPHRRHSSLGNLSPIKGSTHTTGSLESNGNWSVEAGQVQSPMRATT